MHDPFQNYQTLGSYYGLQGQGISPFASSLQNPLINVLANPLVTGGLQNQMNPLLSNPLVAALQNPLVAASLQSQINPILAIAQQQAVAQAIAQQLASQAYSPYQYLQNQPHLGLQSQPGQQSFGQTGFPLTQGLGQTGSPFSQMGYPLAPQSWIGQAGQQQGQPFGQLGSQPFAQQIYPLLAQLAGRQGQMPSSPWGW